MFRFKKLEIEGSYLVTPSVDMKNTCDLIKVFSDSQFNIYGLSTEFKEEYYAIAKPGVIRGMHFQLPPEEQDKIITCILGEIQDVIIDLRKDSKTYGKYSSVKLDQYNKNMIYVPKGCAHGYYIKGNKEALIYYKVTKPFIKELKGGISYKSLNINWDFKNEVEIEEEDNELPSFEDFNSPF
ncbi:dTDP-4-dehydrorhamnose 3,5-epimerase family protein [Clostridium sp.]|uniref:dTDP-4-dehydrorhamnose 3,5-epimerase family protein n=1 Tax=Clostridium sp. TaxID=1506 RepID=UPI00260E919F|nr:dTDP-4-dehydrorhamnose 3,5-epimerase family protein [Clostridium sp.]